MKKLIIIISLIIAIGALSALKFDPDYFVSRSVIVCFTKAAVGNDTGKIDFSREDGYVRTGLVSFDRLAAEYRVTDMRQMHPDVKVPSWNDNGLYLQNTYRLTLDSNERIDAAVRELAKDPNLIYAELEGINRSKFVPNDPMVTQQYAHALIQSFEAWDYTLGSFDVKIGITDSGVKWNHPDLRANIWINPAEAPGMTIDWDAGTISGGDGQDAGEGGNKCDDLVGWDFYNNDNNPIQTYAANDHGTHVAGIAGAVGHNEIGVVGTSPIVSIISCKGSSNVSPSTGIAFAYDQIKYSAEVGADIINASWGSPGSGAYPNSIVNYATNLGALVVTAAGNENMEHNASYQDYPADCDNVLCVASTGQNDVKSSFSDYGAPIDVCAPGDGILSTIIAGNGYDAYDGTSMASPVAAGVAALVKSLHPDMTPLQLRQRMIDTADYIYDVNPDYETPPMLGSGRINSFAATMYDKIPNITIEGTDLDEYSGDGDGIANPGETIELKVALNNYMDFHTGLAWLCANDLETTLSCNYPGVTILQDSASYGTLTAGSTIWNNAEPFRFETVASLPSEPIPFELTVTANPDAEYPYNKVISFNVELSLVQNGWPFDVGGSSTSSPVLYNLDAEPDLEIVFGDQGGYIHALKHDGETELPGFPIQTGCAVVGSLAMSDVDRDGLKDFAASLQNNDIMLFNQNGTELWRVPAGGTLRAGPVIASLEMNDERQVITATQTGNLIVLDANGEDYPNFPVNVGGACLGPVAIADLNCDGTHEILLATLNGNLIAINSSTGESMAGFPVTMQGGSMNPLTIANLDADPQPEIIVTTSTAGYVLAYNHDGSVLFEKNVGGQIKTGAVVADINDDGSQEIIVIGASGMINVLTTSGYDLAGTPITTDQAVECTPTIAYFDNDGQAGIIFGDTDGMLHSIRLDGSESANFPINITGNIKVSASLEDIDRDGDFDIVIPNDAGFFAIDVKRPAQSLEWPCFMGHYNRSGNIFQPVPNPDNPVPELTTALKGNYPNPFNPTTDIKFELAEGAQTSIAIFNQKGQLVKTLVDSSLPAGKHQTQWHGKDDNRLPVSSGVYFYRMRSGKFSSTRKMVLMK
jgi:subtilisin family serine protease